MSKSNIKAVVFDMDGTLLDTAKDIGAVANQTLESMGFPKQPLELFPSLIGHGIRTLFRSACPETASEAEVDATLARYLRAYPENCTCYTTFYAGIEEMLKKLTDAGITVAILSNKTEFIAQKIAKHFMGQVPLQFVWGNNGSRSLKPALDAGALLCQELKLEPSEILFFGDGDTDMEFGSKNGFYTVGCTWGYRPAEVLKEYGAHQLVDTAEELLEILGL